MTTRCGCCGTPHLEVRAARVTGWRDTWSALLCPACDLTPASVQAPLHDRDQVQSGGTRCVRCGRTTRPDSDRCRFHGGTKRSPTT